MLYHASATAGIQVLEPRASNPGTPQVYLSRKRENVLVYLSNAVEKFCREQGFSYDGIWHKWATYGFDKTGRLILEEYYPNALTETYEGVAGYVYHTEDILNAAPVGIPDAVAAAEPMPVIGCEYVPDAWAALCQAAKEDRITIVRYGQLSPCRLEWIRQTMLDEYAQAAHQPDYRFFIRDKFAFCR